MVPTKVFSHTAASGVRKLSVRALLDHVNEHAYADRKRALQDFNGSQRAWPEASWQHAVKSVLFVDCQSKTVKHCGYLMLAGRVWWGDVRLHYAFTPEQLERRGAAANLRELFMVPWTIEHINARLTCNNVLFRLDNTSSLGLAAPAVVSIDIELIAPHIPGRENTLDDCFSRLRGGIDDDDWRLLVDIFRELEAACGPFDADSCSDPLGRKSSRPRGGMLLDAELGYHYIRLRADADKNVDAMHECFAYIPDHAPCLVIRPDNMLEDSLRVFTFACRQDTLDAYFKTSATNILRLIAAL
eukprot:jgi/Tetstr1/441630/TSEL_029856.t1